jgi:hypothetical protein
MTYSFNLMNYVENYTDNWKKISITSLFILLKKAQKTSKKNVPSTVLIFTAFLAGFHNKGVAWLLSSFLL